MSRFFWGTLVGFILGYPIGLYISFYTYKKVKSHING